jgi:uncharacterized membrane protein
VSNVLKSHPFHELRAYRRGIKIGGRCDCASGSLIPWLAGALIYRERAAAAARQHLASVSRGVEIKISKGRFEAFSDGVFAIAITLLVLGFQAPKGNEASAATMGSWLVRLWPQYLVYAATFITIGIMWFNHYALFHHAQHISYGALVANLLLLMLIAFLPYPTLLLGQFGLVPTLLSFYSLLMVLISLCYGALYYVVILKPEERGSIGGFIKSRSLWNTLGPAVYAVAMGLSFASPLGALLLILAMAIFYMLPKSVAAALAAGARGSQKP